MQDAGAQRAAELLDVAAGQRVLDAWRRRGQDRHLLELADLDLLALEMDAMRARRIDENLARLGEGPGARDRLPQGQILVGQPSLRPYPRRCAIIPHRGRASSSLTANGCGARRISPVLRGRSGRFSTRCGPPSRPVANFYATCSVFPEENRVQVAGFVAARPDVALLGETQLLPQEDHDGSTMRCCRKLAELLHTLVLAACWRWRLASQAAEIDLRGIQITPAEDGGLVLATDLAFDFSPRLEEAVGKGLTLHFVAEFELARPRWYWFDERVIQIRQTGRLTYHALTRQYRLSTGALHQSFSSLDEALRSLSRIRNWQIAGATDSRPAKPSMPACVSASTPRNCPSLSGLEACRTRTGYSSDGKRWSFTVPRVSAAVAPVSDDRRGGEMKVLLIVAAAFGAILLFLLATASANTALFARHYPWLIGLHVVVAIALASLAHLAVAPALARASAEGLRFAPQVAPDALLRPDGGDSRAR